MKMEKLRSSYGLRSLIQDTAREFESFQEEKRRGDGIPLESNPLESNALQSNGPRKKHRPQEEQLMGAVRLEGNYHKVDNDVSDLLLPTLKPGEQSVYYRMYRLSYGWGKNWCQASNTELSRLCNLTELRVREHLKSLAGKGLISIIKGKKPNSPTVYRVYLPSEVHTFKEKANTKAEVIPLESNPLESNGFKKAHCDADSSTAEGSPFPRENASKESFKESFKFLSTLVGDGSIPTEA